MTKITTGFGYGYLRIYEDVNADAVETVSFNSSNKECTSKYLSYTPGKTIYISVDRYCIDEQTAYELTINETAAQNWEMEYNNSFIDCTIQMQKERRKQERTIIRQML